MRFPHAGGHLRHSVPLVPSRQAPDMLAFSISPSGQGTAGILESSRVGLALSSSAWSYVRPSEFDLLANVSTFLFSFGMACFFVFFI